jgi:hypothetical protein
MNQTLLRVRAASINFKDNLSDTSAESSEQPDRQELGEGLGLGGIHKGGNTKAKSSLCRNYMEKGTCPYGAKCQFAHGPVELKCNSDQQMSYKTRPCHAFAKKGYCCYGSRCNFLHRAEEFEKGPAIKLRDILYGVRKVKTGRVMELGGLQ